LLRDFFRQKRATKRIDSSPLREDALRTPETQFCNLPDYPWRPRYVSDLPSLNGLRLHYLDEGTRAAALTYLCLHGSTTWSYLFRRTIADLLRTRHRVVAPDLIGFGKSDKPKKQAVHTFEWHLQILIQLVERLDLRNLVLVLQEPDDVLGLTLARAAGQRCAGEVVTITADAAELSDAAYEAPFPDEGHRAALRSQWRRHGSVTI
jgi:tRNA(adenine34) deaminase